MRINESVTNSDAGAISILVAQPEDIPALQRTAAISWWATYSEYLASSFIEDFLTRAYSAHQLVAHFADTNVTFFGRKIQSMNLIGFGQAGPAMARVMMTHLLLRLIYIASISSPQWQGRASGSRLLAGLELWLRQQGYPYYGAYVDERNEPAKSFYARQGFVHKPECDIPEQWYLVKQLE